MAPVVQRLDNTIHWINRYLTDSTVCFAITYLLYSHASICWGSINHPLYNWAYLAKFGFTRAAYRELHCPCWPQLFFTKAQCSKKVTKAYPLISTNTHREKVKGSLHVAIPVPISPRWGRGGVWLHKG